jgi:hypothetical protein
MSTVLVVGVVVSALVAYLARKKTRRVGVSAVVTSQGFSEDTIAAIRGEPGDALLTITLQDGRTFQTTATEAAKRLQSGPDGKPSFWLTDSSSNWLSLLLFALGCALSVYLYFLSKPAA